MTQNVEVSEIEYRVGFSTGITSVCRRVYRVQIGSFWGLVFQKCADLVRSYAHLMHTFAHGTNTDFWLRIPEEMLSLLALMNRDVRAFGFVGLFSD